MSRAVGPQGLAKSLTRGLSLVPLALAALPAVSGADALRFDFTPGGNAAGQLAYEPARGFGFEPADTSDAPSRFSVRVPEGNYHVRLAFARGRDALPREIRAEQRRLVFEPPIGSRAPREIRFAVNVRIPDLPALPANAAGGRRVSLEPRELGSRTWDDRLTLEISPWPASLLWIEIIPADVPTLYLAGDSTVTDQGAAPNGSWGQYLPRYFADSIAIANHAESGESLKSFVTGLRFAKLLSTLRPGDWVMIQFGHNDQKQEWPQTYAEASTTYRSWLHTYIAEIRRRGATPLLVTSPERRNFDTDGHIRPTLAEYAAAMRAVAKEERVALLDLQPASVRFYEALGPAMSPRAFADGGNDRTHHNDYGARQLARAVIEALRGANTARTGGLERHIAADAGVFDAGHPPLPD